MDFSPLPAEAKAQLNQWDIKTLPLTSTVSNIEITESAVTPGPAAPNNLTSNSATSAEIGLNAVVPHVAPVEPPHPAIPLLFKSAKELTIAIKHVVSLVKKRAYKNNQPQILAKVLDAKNNYSGEELFKKLKEIKREQTSITQNNISSPIKSYIDNRVTIVNNIANSFPNPLNWPDHKLNAFYANLHDPNIMLTLDDYLRDPKTVAHWKSLGRAKAEKLKENSTLIVL